MHLHEKRCIKRAGVAGIALRAEGANMYTAACASASLCGFLVQFHPESVATNHRLRSAYTHACCISPMPGKLVS